MGKYKENAMYNILSIRVSDEEKAIMEKIKLHSQKSISTIMREAMYLYSAVNGVVTIAKH